MAFEQGKGQFPHSSRSHTCDDPVAFDRIISPHRAPEDPP